MDENLHHIDKLFKDGLGEHEQAPPARVWNSLENALDKKGISSVTRKYSNLKRLSVILLLLLTGTVIFEISLRNEREKDQVQLNRTSPSDEVINESGPNTSPSSDKALNQESDIKRDTNPTDKIPSEKRSSLNNTPKPANTVRGDSGPPPAGPERYTTKNKTSANPPQWTATTPQYGSSRIRGSKETDTQSGFQKTGTPVHNSATRPWSGTDLFPAGLSFSLAKIEPPGSFTMDGLIQSHPPTPAWLPAFTDPVTTGKTALKKAAGTPHGRLALEVSIAPQVAFSTLKDDDHGPGGGRGNDRDDFKGSEKYLTTYDWRLLLQWPLKNRWALQSGISYLNNSIEIEPKKVFAQLDNSGEVKYLFDCSSGYTYINPKTGYTPGIGDSLLTIGSKSNLQYLGVPLIINRTLLTGKWNIVPALGVRWNYLIRKEIETGLEDAQPEKQSSTNIQGIKKTYFDALGSIALQFNLNRKIAFKLAPSIDLALNPINRNASVKTYSNSFGIAAGIKVNL